jgi:septal ring factor EnvC (AmiA/AmiB activator)
VSHSWAQIYRWTDETGRVHFTNNPETIPADRLPYSREMTSTPAITTAPTPPATAAPGVSPRLSPPHDQDVQQQIQALEQQIAATRQERQRLLEELKAARPIRMNPAFGRERRQVDDLGRALATVEKQLDTLYAEWQQLSRQQSASSREPSPERAVILDKYGHDRSYWQQRFQSLRDRLRLTREQRQAVLGKLAGELSEEGRTFGRRGREVLDLANILEQLNQDIHTTETALQALRREATNAGAPPQWLE